MKRPSTSRRPSSSATDSGVGDAREYLERIARILVHSGHSPRDLSRLFTQICRELREPGVHWDSARLNFVSDLPHVITYWHSDAQYLDSAGAPIPLPMKGRGPSLTSLVRRALPNVPPPKVIQALLELNGIRRDGHYFSPVSQFLTYNQQRTSALAHGLTALLGMLRTVEHNVASRRGETLFERAAINPHFPVSELAGFHRRLKVIAGDFVWKIDGDMRRRETKRRGGRRTRLGVGVFAFEEPQITGKGKATLARAVARRTGRP